jgi:hypothetical protein
MMNDDSELKGNFFGIWLAAKEGGRRDFQARGGKMARRGCVLRFVFCLFCSLRSCPRKPGLRLSLDDVSGI